jgi:hypothetical protein
LDNCERHDAMHRFSRSWLVSKDPDAEKPTQASTSKASTSKASTNRALKMNKASTSRASTSIMARRPHPYGK